MEELLCTENLCRQFGGVMATNRVCFSVNQNGLTSIIGPNGAGKTTFINIVTGKINASSGKILFKEKDITNKPTHELVKLGICRTFQINSLFGNLSVFENLRIARQAKIGGSFRIFSSKNDLKSITEDTWVMIEQLGLKDLAARPANNLAYGDQRVLEVAIAMAGDPKILFLDEPTAGMSPAETRHISKLIKELARDICVVLVEHDMDMVMSISDRITVLQDGCIISEGTPEEIRNNQQVKEAYLEKKNKILHIEDIQTYYGVSHVIQGLSMHVNQQEAVSIIGRNGAGKTTTLRSIMGLTPPRSGNIVIDGSETTKWPPHKISNLGVAYVPAERHIFPGLSVEENLRLAARPGKGSDAWTLEKVCDHFPVLAERTHQDGATLSGGEQQMLAIGRALISNPKIIIMDEPSQGLSPLLVQMITDVVLTFCVKSGITLLIVEQNYHMALKVASRHYLMDTRGEIVNVASTQELMDNPEIIQSHLSV